MNFLGAENNNLQLIIGLYSMTMFQEVFLVTATFLFSVFLGKICQMHTKFNTKSRVYVESRSHYQTCQEYRHYLCHVKSFVYILIKRNTCLAEDMQFLIIDCL